jgi:hypothetical protein
MRPDLIIPDHWTPQQALAIFEFLDQLRDRIWARYGDQLTEQLRIERGQPDPNDPQLELPLFDDAPI